MRRTQPIAVLALAAALTVPPVAAARTPAGLLADAAPLVGAAPLADAALLAAAVPLADTTAGAGSRAAARLLADATPLDAGSPAAARLLADATPLSEAPVPRDAAPLTQTPLADRDGAEFADAGNPRQLLAQAPEAVSTPPATSLPHTGAELWLTLLAGGGMVLAGAGLRLRLRPLPASSA